MAAATFVTFTGLKEARAYVAGLRDGAQAAGRMSVLVGSALRYARAQEFGVGRRRGRFYLTQALRAIQGRIKPELVAALPFGPETVWRALLTLGHDVERIAKQRAPVKTGTLRRSIHLVAARRG